MNENTAHEPPQIAGNCATCEADVYRRKGIEFWLNLDGSPHQCGSGDTITIADVAAKLGLKRRRDGDFWGPFPGASGSSCLYLSGTLGTAVRWGTGDYYNAREVFKLAGYPEEDYDRYEGREPEPSQAAEGKSWCCGADRWEEESKSLEYGSRAWAELWCLTHDEADDGTAGAYTCLLDEGHDGPHVWTPDFTLPSPEKIAALKEEMYQHGLRKGRSEGSQVLADALAALKAWQDWEARLINYDEAWRGGLPTIPQHLLDALTPIQEQREAVIAQAEAAQKETK